MTIRVIRRTASAKKILNPVKDASAGTDSSSLAFSLYNTIYDTIQYNCLFRAPIAKNKSYSKALYIVQCSVHSDHYIILSVINLKKMRF